MRARSGNAPSVNHCGDTYNLQVQCDAENQETTDPNTGCFDFIEGSNSHMSCGGSQAVVPTGSIAAKDDGHEGAGTQAKVLWQTSGDSGVQTELDLTVDVAYTVGECLQSGPSQCLTLAELTVMAPDQVVAGFSVGAPRLSLLGASVTPEVDSRGAFTFPTGSIEFNVDYNILGSRNQLHGFNQSPVSGHVLPLANDLEFDSIELSHSDPFVDATLYVSIQGAHHERAPIADLVALDDPGICAQAVLFGERSTDPDGDSMTHTWEVPELMISSTGKQFAVVLPAGTSTITLLSIDTASRSDAISVQYERRCR